VEAASILPIVQRTRPPSMSLVELIRMIFISYSLHFNWIYCEPSAEVEFSFESSGLTFT
jgi:hypothetical protein